MIEFEIVEAEEYCDSVRDGTHDSPKKTEKGFKLITSKHIMEYGLDLKNAYFISEKDYIKVNERSAVNENDILYSMIGTVGLIHRVNYKPNYAIKNMGLFKIKEELKSKWLYYYLKTPNMKEYINSLLNGSTQQYITLSNLRKLPIKVPKNKMDMEKIVKILDIIEEKIVLNSKINDNLLEICQNLYKEWFMNFNYPNHDERLKDSEKGLIPINWSINQIQDIVDIKRGASPRPIQDYLSDKGLNWLKISDVTGINEPFIYNIKEKIKEEGKDRSRFITKGTLVVSNSATPGIPKFIEVDTCVHDGWLILQGYKDYYKEFIYFLILDIRQRLLQLANGSVFQNLKTDILKEYKFINPTEDVLKNFHNLIKPLMEKINANVQANIVLEQLRDTLLPKLMNGEIDLDKIEI